MLELRKVMRLGADDSRTEVAFAQLRRGDRFTLDGGASDHEQGTSIYVATSDAYPVEPEGNFGIDVEDRPNK